MSSCTIATCSFCILADARYIARLATMPRASIVSVLYSPGDIESVAAIVEDWAAQSVADVAPERFAKTALAGALRIIAPLL